MADTPFVPADPALIEAVKHPEPVEMVAAANRQADALELAARAQAAFAGIDAKPYPPHEVYLRARIAAMQSGLYTAEGTAHGAALALARDYSEMYPS